MRRNPAAHRLATEVRAFKLFRHSTRDRAIARLEPWLWVGTASARLRVRKIEAENGDIVLLKRLRHVDQESRVHPMPSAMRQHERSARREVGPVPGTRHCAVAPVEAGLL